ncbi:MAG TPA: MFS transporter [Candidatus Baltobacteraceae bacterium]|jgi:MFS family permease|nr:MFS transporter [Candidatus Baltobacteraceae bacterium]
MIKRLAPILGITFIDILGFSMLIPLLPYYVTHFHAAPVVVGALFSVFSFCQLVSGPIWGNFSDRIGRKGVLIISQIGATIGWAMLGWAPTIPWIFAARILEGISGGNIGVTQAYVADLVTPKERARAFGYIGATFASAFAFGPAIAGILQPIYGYSVPLYLAALLQFITLIVTIVVLPESRSKKEEAGAVGPDEIYRTFRNPRLSPMLWQKLALSLTLYGWFGVMALYLAHQLHFTFTQTSYFFAGFSIINAFVNAIVVGRASERLGDRLMSTIGIGALVVGFSFVPFVRNLYELIGLMLFFSVGMAFGNTGLTALISGAVDERRQGTVLSVTSSLDSFAGIVAPPVSTAFLGGLGSAWAGAWSLIFATIAFALGAVQGGGTKSQNESAANAAPSLAEADS